MEEFVRTELQLGADAMETLAHARVAVFGVGGVGGYVVEALARSGVGALDLIDDDRVSLSNINRQILATHSTVGRHKVDVAAERVRDINPQAVVKAWKTFYTPQTAELFDFTQYDYVVDAIDTVTGKLALVQQAQEAGVMVISAMGAGNKLDPTAFRVTDIYKTSGCPLARVMRKELKKRGIKGLKVVFSTEEPTPPDPELMQACVERDLAQPDTNRPGKPKRQVPGSNAFVPAVAGLILAGEVVRDLIRRGNKNS